MTRKPSAPVRDAPLRLRQRLRSDGTWRIWWEPDGSVRDMGFAVVELWPDSPMKSGREARRLNALVEAARKSGGVRPRARNTRHVEDLIADYRRSDFFTDRAAKTRVSYDKNLRAIAAKWGDVPVTDLTKPVLRTWYETLRQVNGAWAAAALIRMMSILMTHAEIRGWRPEGTNPAKGLKVSVPKGRSRAASWPEFDALMTSAHVCGLPSIAQAVSLSALQGQRMTDVLAARRQEFQRVAVTYPGQSALDIWVWRFVRSKRGNAGALPLHPEAVPEIEAALAVIRAPDAPLIWEERIGRPYDEDLFGKRWAEVRAHAARAVPSVADLQFRDLRRTFGVNARDGGASVDDAGDALGNSAAQNPALKATYMPPSFFTASRAVAAVQRPPTEKRKEA